jgi:acetyl esterase/lipase
LTFLDCDYAKAPEYPCPSEAEDARDVYEYILQHSKKYNFDLNKITVGGFSAGGTIAMGLAVTIGAETRAKLKDGEQFVHPIKAAIAFYSRATWLGAMSKVAPPPTPKERKELVGGMLPDHLFEPIYKMYLFPPTFASAWSTPAAEEKEREKERREALKKRPDVSPAEADLRNFPPQVVLYTCQYDQLAPELNVLRDRLKEVDGIKLYGKYVIGVGHGWDGMVRKGQFGYEEKELAYSTVAQVIAKAGGITLKI